MVKKNSIPDRWRSLKSIGQRVPGARFIAFKVPLKGVTNQRVTQNQKFTPKDLITAIRSQSEELGLIIDLTNTERYYTTKDLPKSVQYVKLHTAGLKIPDDATIHQFKRVVWKFLAANSDNDRLIGVHCTTGINRTGHLICRYLIDVDEWRPLHALSAFAQARGHPIEGTVYIEDIVKGPPRSNVGIDMPPAIGETLDGGDDTYSDDMPRDRRIRDKSIKSLLELIPGNEYVDFDARDPRPHMRPRPDDGRDFFNPDFRGRRPPFDDMDDDIDLRNPSERRVIPPSVSELLNASERLRRPVQFNPEGRFKPGPENRPDLYASEPRPLMNVRDGPRDMQRPHGMQHEQGGYSERMRGRPGPVQGFEEYDEPNSSRVPSFPPGRMNSDEYDDLEPPHLGRALLNELDYLERMRRGELQEMDTQNDRIDPRDGEMMSSPYNERMHPRNVRPQEGPMSDGMPARNTQLQSKPLYERRPLSDKWDMEDPVPERMHPRDPRFVEGPMPERFPQRDGQGFRNAPDERMHLRDGRPMNGPMNERVQPRDAQFMEGPMNNRMYPRDARQTEASVNERPQPRVTRLMDIPLNERLNPRDGPIMENSMNDRIPPRTMNRGDGLMPPRDPRSMGGPLNTRMHPRMDRAMMEGNVNDQREARPMEGYMNERMYPRDAPNVQLRDNRNMERPIPERMYPQEEEYPINQQRDFMNDQRPFEGRKMNPSEDALRGTNRFAPYPSMMKPGQPSAIPRGGLPRLAGRDPRDMLPPSQDASHFPPRTRFN